MLTFATHVPDALVARYAKLTPPWGPLGYVTYKRTYSRKRPDLGRAEEWVDTTARSIQALLDYGGAFTHEEVEELFDHMFNLRGMPAGRGLWQLGAKTVEKVGGDSLMNCWFVPLSELESFCFVFDQLMLGGGVGFSVLPSHVHKLPPVKRAITVTRTPGGDVNFIVPDNREGWVELLRRVLQAFFVTGKDFSYSTACVRGHGAPISGFGGTASGPEKLAEGIAQIAAILAARAGKYVRSIDALDIANIIGSIVVAGNVRRSAEIAIGHATDRMFLQAKDWGSGSIPNWRAMSNNTAACDDVRSLPEEFWDGYRGKGEPYGLFNLDLCRSHGRLKDGPGHRPDPDVIGVNPCMVSTCAVLTPEGLRTIADIDVGSVIWSETGWTKVVGKWSRGIKPTFRYRTAVGCFDGTSNHRIISNDLEVEVGKAESIDRVIGPTNESLIDGHDPQAIMDGLVLGDGTVQNRRRGSSARVYLCVGEGDLCYHDSEVGHLIKKRVKVGERGSWKIVTTIAPHELARTYARQVPDRFFKGSFRTVCSFLRGLFSANGCVKGNRVALKATSRAVIDRVQVMLASLGIRSYVSVNQPCVARFGDRTSIRKMNYDLVITSDRRRFAELIGFLQPRKMARLAGVCETRLTKYSKKSFPILSVEPLGDQEVFDIAVDNQPHRFWLDGLRVRNCGEQTLAAFECCDLVEQVLPRIRDRQEFHRVAALMYKAAKTMICLPFSWPQTQAVVEKNRRIGIGVTGVCQSPFGPDDFDEVYKHLEELDREYSKTLNVARSIKLTTVKPSGTVSLLPGVTPGVHPAYAPYYLRRIRFSADDPLVDVCRANGYHVEPVYGFDGKPNHDTMVVSFPVATPPDAILARDTTAIKQIELQHKLQTHWSDNSVSVTVYYRPEELPEIRAHLADNYRDNTKTISFLLHQEHGFRQAPYEEITRAQYEELAGKTRPITSSKPDDDDDERELAESAECAGGMCPVR